ncbi:hypothetical protein ASC87_22735 [Rhizobacter sp. Root1221]|nr:hypothetical protein ASC87_22735 [Rhizobacter sp. Root1221]
MFRRIEGEIEMTDDIAVGMPRRGWSAVGGRVMPPATGRAAEEPDTAPPRARRELTGHVSFASSDGLLGPGRRLRFRRARWARQALVWLLVVLLAPAVAGWAWGLVGGTVR